MTNSLTSKERFTPEYISEVVKELESRGWRPDSRGDPECYDEASAAGAQIIEHLQNLLKLETAALEQACAAPVDSPMTVEQARATDEPSVTPDAWMSEDGRIISRDAKEFGSRHPTAKSASDPFTIPLYRAAVPPSAIPDVLFDGTAVWQEAKKIRNPIDPMIVSDVLDAVVRLLRASATKSGSKL